MRIIFRTTEVIGLMMLLLLAACQPDHPNPRLLGDHTPPSRPQHIK
jgi:hypothetical protein